MEFGTIIETDEYRDLCERVAIAEERLNRLYDYIENEDKEYAKSCGSRSYSLRTDEVKLIVGYTEKMAAFGEIKAAIEAYEAKHRETTEEEKEENNDGESI